MKKTLAIATLALGLFAFGCDDDEDGGKTDAATDAATNKPDATSDAVTTTPDAKADTAAPLPADGGTSADADSSDAVASDAGADWAMCANPKVGVSASDFCLQYMKACTVDPTGGTATMERYKSFSLCLMEYSALTAAKQGCVAYHLCAASMPGNAALHCPHPPQASLATPTGPCANAM